MSRIGQFGIPGQSAAVFTQTNEMFWGGDDSRIEILHASNGQVDAAAVDAGSSPTTTLRTGLLMGKITATGLLKQWDSSASDGSEILHSVNRHELSTLDAYGGTRELWGPMVVKAPLKAKALYIKGSALVGHADEYLARNRLALMGCKLDDDPWGWLAGINQRNIAKTVTGAILATENGALFVVTGAGAVTLTLPAIKPGLRFSFLNTADQNLVVASAEGDNMIILNDASADSITFSTASQKIGAQLHVLAMYVGGVLKWVQTSQLATPTTAT